MIRGQVTSVIGEPEGIRVSVFVHRKSMPFPPRSPKEEKEYQVKVQAIAEQESEVRLLHLGEICLTQEKKGGS